MSSAIYSHVNYRECSWLMKSEEEAAAAVAEEAQGRQEGLQSLSKLNSLIAEILAGCSIFHRTLFLCPLGHWFFLFPPTFETANYTGPASSFSRSHHHYHRHQKLASEAAAAQRICKFILELN